MLRFSMVKSKIVALSKGSVGKNYNQRSLLDLDKCEISQMLFLIKIF